MRHKRWFVTHFLIVLFGLLPVLSIVVASLLAFVVGCENVNEGSVPECVAGGLIYNLFVLGWLGLVTIPIAGLLIILSVGAHITFWTYYCWKGNKSKSTENRPT